MRDSAAKRIFWLLIFGLLVGTLIYASFWWSLGQTIQFTSILVPGSRGLGFISDYPVAGVVFGIFIQFSPTACLYMASAFNANDPKEQNSRLLWLGAFWGISLFDGLTNLGARLDDISVQGLPSFGFENQQFAQYAQIMMTVMGVILDFAIVFAEELLGHWLGVFFDNLSALITLLGGTPPKWFAMVSSVGRAVGGQNMKNQQPDRPGPGGDKKQKGRPDGNRSDNRPDRPNIDPNRNNRQSPDSRPEPRNPRDIPVRGRGQERPPITIRPEDRD